MPNSAVTIVGKLIDRSRGQPGQSAPSSKEIMDTFAAWPEFIMGFTGWSRVESGTLTIDCCDPLPGPPLKRIAELATEPLDLLDGFRPSYGQFLRDRRGLRRYYGAVARANGLDASAIVSQQERPAKADRLEVYSNARLRDALKLNTGNEVQVDVLEADVWREQFASVP